MESLFLVRMAVGNAFKLDVRLNINWYFEHEKSIRRTDNSNVNMRCLRQLAYLCRIMLSKTEGGHEYVQ